MVQPGDTVKIICKDASYEGILMPRPQLLSEGVTVLKLPSGYNIGIQKKSITSLLVTKSYTEKKKTAKTPPHNPSLPTVALVSCGGTISSRVDYLSGGVHADYDASDFVAMCPEILSHANIVTIRAKQIMSEDATSEDWIDIARAVADALNKGADGAVVTHGTDTLHYSAAVLSYLLHNTTKPIVITGAQRSIDRPSSDAFMNLNCAVITAASKKLSGVMTCLHGTSNDNYCLLIRGTKVRKMHTSRRDAFRPLNDNPLGQVYPSGKLVLSEGHCSWANSPVNLDGGFEPKTGILMIHPGILPATLDYYHQNKYRGLVISATALGHVPTIKNSFIAPLKKLISMGMIIVISSQTLYGRVHPYVYTNLRRLSLEAGAIYVEDLHPETAYAKLGWALSKTKDAQEVKRLLETPLCQDISLRSAPFHSFLA